jgi:hypothetical protein
MCAPISSALASMDARPLSIDALAPDFNDLEVVCMVSYATVFDQE